jgi:hypothetical protein
MFKKYIFLKNKRLEMKNNIKNSESLKRNENYSSLIDYLSLRNIILQKDELNKLLRIELDEIDTNMDEIDKRFKEDEDLIEIAKKSLEKRNLYEIEKENEKLVVDCQTIMQTKNKMITTKYLDWENAKKEVKESNTLCLKGCLGRV